jgi:putative ABC transport system ATP-binding protein
VIHMMRELAHKQGRAVVIVTHDSRVLEFGDRTVRMEDGRIVAPPANDVPGKMAPHWAIPAEAQTVGEAC